MVDPRIAFFDRLAENWDAEEPSSETMIDRLEEMADLLQLSAGQSLLEVGCGTGKTSGWLARQVQPGRVTAVDFAPAMIQRAQAKGIPVEFQCADVCCDDLGESMYDVIFCFHCFPHFRDQPAALTNLIRAMKPAGQLLVIHMRGSAQINAFHAHLEGDVSGDMLPVGPTAWDALLTPVGMQRCELIDRDDLFFLRAKRHGATND